MMRSVVVALVALALAPMPQAQSAPQIPTQPRTVQPGMTQPSAVQPGTVQPIQGNMPSDILGTGSAGPVGTMPITLKAIQPTGKIAQITILGNKNISTATIQAALTEKVGDEFETQAAEKDQAAITAMGYWAQPARYSASPNDKGGVDLTFIVIENPVISAIRFNANTFTGQPTIPAETLLAQMQTKPGQVLKMPLLQDDLKTLFAPGTGYASRQGYLFTAGSSTTIDPRTGVLTIPVVEADIQAIIVPGVSASRAGEIVGALPIRPGDVYNKNAVQNALSALSGKGKFQVPGAVQVEQTMSSRVILIVPAAQK